MLKRIDRVLLAGLFVLVLPSASALAQGQPSETYRELVREALAEFEAKQYQEALNLFRQAYDVRPSARVLRGMGKSLFELGRYTEALDALRASLTVDLDPLSPRLREDVQELIARTERYVGTLVLSVEPADAKLKLRGRPVAPGPIQLDIGTYEIEAMAEGYLPVRRRVEVVGQASTELNLVLDSDGSSGPRTAAQPQLTSTPPKKRSRAMLYTGAGLAAAGAGGLAGSLVWLFDRNDALDACDAASSVGLACSNEDDIETERTISIVTTAVSGAALAAGATLIVLHLTSDRGGRSAQSPSEPDWLASCGPSLDGAMCHAAVRF
ncbi:MAG: tetratricopeptide repeat protein [Myxococcota bacterium]